MSSKIPLSAMSNYYTPELREFLSDLGEIAALINPVEMLTAVNAGAEKEKFLKRASEGHFENPNFRYDGGLLGRIAVQRADVREMMERMPKVLRTLSMELPGQVLAEMVKTRFLEVYQLVDAAGHVLLCDNRAANAELKSVFGFPSDEIVTKAHAHAQNLANGAGTVCHDTPERKARREALKALEFDAKGIRENFLWAAKQLGIDGSRPVEINSLATAIDVRDKSSQGAMVVIPETRKVNGGKLVELTAHEICCHWGDSTRAEIALPLLGSGNLKPSDEMLYEGHAVMADFNTHANLGEAAPRYQAPWYILAMDLARQGLTFSEMTQRLYEMVRPTTNSDKAAWNTVWTACYRVKRGSNGSDNIYVLTKDRAYFEGRILTEELRANGLGSALSIATISVSDLELLKLAVDFGKGPDYLEQTWALQERLCEKLLAE